MDKIKDYYFDLKKISYIERDKNGKVLYTNNPDILGIYDEIVSSNVCEGNQYYHSGSKTWYEIIKADFYSEEDLSVHVVEYLEDITKLKEKISKLNLDSLTGLMRNRIECNKMINDYIEYALKKDEEFSILIGDIDYFKNINDTYGHHCGDYVLKTVSKILLDNTYQFNDKFDYHNKDIILRLGGDEFLILLKNISLESTISKIKVITSKIEHEDINYNGKSIPVSMSLGYAHFNKDEFLNQNIDSIREKLSIMADENLYMIKKNRNS